ncbi:glutathione S-transferase family protein [Sphingomonas sp.]|uniref:glutathione S-transferase family protein n=1 Tax=Sphingomonas sp. TaxID=28214 RepID=UPI001B0EB104|nr:glutathione S-transferase family protein [Sphingomonas sp.]MBO9714042.1 glutathione S-transferase family protein [Sphingomonas sp.]
MSKFIVHGIPGSPYVRSPLLVLKEKGLDWELAAFGFGGQRAPEHLERQPFAKMPAFEHDGFRLYEVQAILRYIDRIAPEPAMTPADPRQAARMDQLLNIADCYLAPRITGAIAFQRLVAPRFGMPCDEAKIAGAMPDAGVAVGEVARLMGEGPYLVGDQPTLADFHLIAQLSFLPQCAEGRVLLAPYPQLAAWIARMAERPSMARTEWERLAGEADMPVPPMPAETVAA